MTNKEAIIDYTYDLTSIEITCPFCKRIKVLKKFKDYEYICVCGVEFNIPILPTQKNYTRKIVVNKDPFRWL